MRLRPDGATVPKFRRQSKAAETLAVDCSDGESVWHTLLRLRSSYAAKLPKPQSRAVGDDWLRVVEEPPQTVKSFRRLSLRAYVHGTYDTIFLQPVGLDRLLAKGGGKKSARTRRGETQRARGAATSACTGAGTGAGTTAEAAPGTELVPATAVLAGSGRQATTATSESESELDDAAALRAIRSYLQCFFPGLSAKVMPTPAALRAGRAHPEHGHAQLLCADVYDCLSTVRRTQREVARTAVALIGVSGTDLYPSDDFAEVSGEADPMNGVAVISWFGHRQWCPDHPLAAGDGSPPPPALVLKRIAATTSHEVCHLFGLHHCVYRHCLMNGSNNQVESDARPALLCPVCLRKLHLALVGEGASDAEARAWIVQRYEPGLQSLGAGSVSRPRENNELVLS